MATALIYSPPGGGKTVNSTLVATRDRGRNLMINTDNSSIVLRNFERKNLDVEQAGTVDEFVAAFRKGYESKKYDTIILDNLSDLFDLWILELTDSKDGENKVPKDARQVYQFVYQSIKRLTREATRVDCDVLFTAWSDTVQFSMPDGQVIQRVQPKLPGKIIDNVAGLMNVVGYVNSAVKDDKRRWYYITESSPNIMAKDQIACRKAIMPEEIFKR